MSKFGMGFYDKNRIARQDYTSSLFHRGAVFFER